MHGVLPRDDVDHVTLHVVFVAARNDRLPAARDGHRAVAQRRLLLVEARQRLPHQRRGRLQTEDHERELAARKVDVLGGRGVAQQVDDLAGRHLLGVEQVVDAHVDEHLLVVGFEVFVVVDAGDRLARAELLGQHRRDDVVVLLVVDGDEEVALAHGGLAQHGEGRRVALDADDVGQAAHLGEELLIGVDDGDVVAVSAQHLGQVAAHFAGARYHDFHRFGFVCEAVARSGMGRSAFAGNIFAIYPTNVYICPRKPKFTGRKICISCQAG